MADCRAHDRQDNKAERGNTEAFKQLEPAEILPPAAHQLGLRLTARQRIDHQHETAHLVCRPQPERQSERVGKKGHQGGGRHIGADRQGEERGQKNLAEGNDKASKKSQRHATGHRSAGKAPQFRPSEAMRDRSQILILLHILTRRHLGPLPPEPSHDRAGCHNGKVTYTFVRRKKVVPTGQSTNSNLTATIGVLPLQPVARDHAFSRMIRALSRFQSCSFRCARLSCACRPLASASSTFARPRPLK